MFERRFLRKWQFLPVEELPVIPRPRRGRILVG